MVRFWKSRQAFLVNRPIERNECGKQVRLGVRVLDYTVACMRVYSLCTPVMHFKDYLQLKALSIDYSMQPRIDWCVLLWAHCFTVFETIFECGKGTSFFYFRIAHRKTIENYALAESKFTNKKLKEEIIFPKICIFTLLYIAVQAPRRNTVKHATNVWQILITTVNGWTLALDHEIMGIFSSYWIFLLLPIEGIVNWIAFQYWGINLKLPNGLAIKRV